MRHRIKPLLLFGAKISRKSYTTIVCLTIISLLTGCSSMNKLLWGKSYLTPEEREAKKVERERVQKENTEREEERQAILAKRKALIQKCKDDGYKRCFNGVGWGEKVSNVDSVDWANFPQNRYHINRLRMLPREGTSAFASPIFVHYLEKKKFSRKFHPTVCAERYDSNEYPYYPQGTKKREKEYLKCIKFRDLEGFYLTWYDHVIGAASIPKKVTDIDPRFIKVKLEKKFGKISGKVNFPCRYPLHKECLDHNSLFWDKGDVFVFSVTTTDRKGEKFLSMGIIAQKGFELMEDVLDKEDNRKREIESGKKKKSLKQQLKNLEF